MYDNGESDTFYDTILINPAPPTASFIIIPTSNNTLQFNSIPVNDANYYWDFGDGTFDSVQNPSHTYSANGNYLIKLKVTDKKTGCAANDQDTYNIILSGIDDEAITKNIFIFPNPASSFVQLNSGNSTSGQLDNNKFLSDFPFSIFDILGNKILEGITKNNQIDVSSLQSGIYILKTEYGTATFAKL